MRKNSSGVPRFSIGQQADVPVCNVEAVKLKPLSAADVLAEDEIITAWPVVRGGNPVGEKGQLRAGSSRYGYPVDLRYIAKAGCNQDLPRTGAQSSNEAERKSTYWSALAAIEAGTGGIFSVTRLSPGRITAAGVGALLCAYAAKLRAQPNAITRNNFMMDKSGDGFVV